MTVTVSISPLGKQQFNQNGVPLAGGKLFTYAAGTTIKQATFTDSSANSQNTNPIFLDANGQCDLWLDNTLTYKYVLSPPTDTDPPTNPYWTIDNISSTDAKYTIFAGSTGDANVGHIGSETGALATTVQSKLREHIDAVSDFDAVADFGITPPSTNNVNIQNALDSFGSNGGTVFIKKGVAWDYSLLTHPDEVAIIDYSGYDWVNSQWTGQVKFITKTASPGTKNANEFQIIAPYHPALAIDNVGDGLTEQRSSVVYRQDGATDWQHGTTTGTSGRIYAQSYYGTYAGTAYPNGTNIYGIDPSEGNFGFNSLPVSGADYYFVSVRANTSICKYANLTTQSWERQYANASNGLLLREQISGADGSFNYLLNGNTCGQISADGESFGSKFKLITKSTNYTLTTTTSSTSDVGCSITNSAGGGVTFTLPAATPGLWYEAVVTVSGITLAPATGEKFRAKSADATYASTTLGSIIQVKCYAAGIWDIPVITSGWA